MQEVQLHMFEFDTKNLIHIIPVALDVICGPPLEKHGAE
jgi:hypothetical protein